MILSIFSAGAALMISGTFLMVTALTTEGKNMYGLGRGERVCAKILCLVLYVVHIWVISKLIPHPVALIVNAGLLILCYCMGTKMARK